MKMNSVYFAYQGYIIGRNNPRKTINQYVVKKIALGLDYGL